MSRLILFIAALLLVACGRDTEPQTNEALNMQALPEGRLATRAAAQRSSELLARIDDDTAMLWLSLEPMPQAVIERTIERTWAQMAELSARQRPARDAVTGDGQRRLLQALLAEIEQLRSPAAYTERGLDINGIAASHLAGLYPLMHWELSDQPAFAAMLARIEREAGTAMPRRSVGDQELIWIAFDRFGLAIHHDAHFVSLGLIEEREDLLRRVANLERPANPLQRSELDAFSRSRGLSQHNFGYVDFLRLLEQWMTSEDAALAESGGRGALAAISQDPACRSELAALARLFPRMSFGLTEMSESTVAMQMRLETEPELGGRLRQLADTPIGLSTERAGILNLGMAVNLIAARDFGRSITGGWVQQPPQCALFSGIADRAAGWQLALNRPIPPVVTNVHGAMLRIDRLEIDQGEATNPAGTLALFMRNPQMMIGMAQLFSPQLAAMDLRPGGPPQALPAGLVPDLDGVPAWLALSSTGLGLAIGAGQDSALPAALATGTSDGAIYVKGLNLEAYAQLLALDIGGLTGPGMPGMALDLAESAAALEMFAAVYRYMDMGLHLTPSGIDMRLRFELAD